MKKRKKVVVLALIIFSSFLTSLLFQNCSGGIQSQADLPSQGSGGNNTSSGTPNPGALPTGCTGTAPGSITMILSACPAGEQGTGTKSIIDYVCVGTTYQQAAPRTVVDCSPAGTPPLSAAEIGNICDDYLANVTPDLTNTVTTTSMTSGLGDGANATGNGDAKTGSITATLQSNISTSSQHIRPPYKYVTGSRSDPEVNCAYTSTVTCDVLPDDPLTDISQAYVRDVTSPYYGQNAASAIKSITDSKTKSSEWSTFVKGIFSTAKQANGSTCSFDFQDPLNSTSKNYTLDSMRNNGSGYMCVEGTVRVRMRVRSSTPNGTNMSNFSADKFLLVTIKNGCLDETKLLPNPQALPTTANYGAVVAASDRWIVSLSQSDNNGSISQIGSVSIFDKNNLSLAPTKLYLSNLTGGGSGGDGTVSAAIVSNSSGNDWLAVGAFNRSTYVGQVQFYVYQNSSWVKKGNTLTTNQTDKFGYSVALNSSGLLAVGAPRYSNIQTNGTGDLSGRVFLYSCTANGCSANGQITNPDKGAYFGASLSLSGNRLAVGAPYVTAQSDSHGDGFVRVFDISGSTSAQVGSTILPPGNTSVSTGPSDIQISNPVETGGVKAGRGFGSSVAVNGNRLIVGAPNKSKLSSGTLVAKVGEAYYYKDFSSYVNSTSANPAGVVTLKNSSAPQDSRYGQGVSISSNGAFAGCPYCQNNMGQVYYFKFTDGAGTISGTPTQSIFPLDRINRDGYGNAIFANDADLIVGASNRTVGSSTQAGAAYRYPSP